MVKLSHSKEAAYYCQLWKIANRSKIIYFQRDSRYQDVGGINLKYQIRVGKFVDPTMSGNGDAILKKTVVFFMYLAIDIYQLQLVLEITNYIKKTLDTWSHSRHGRKD